MQGHTVQTEYLWKCCDCLSFFYGGDKDSATKSSREHRIEHEHSVEHKTFRVIGDASGRFPEMTVVASGIYTAVDIK